MRPLGPDAAGKRLLINHTLWNRDDKRIYFLLRTDFHSTEKRLDIPCTIRPDGTGLAVHSRHIGGHPEWENGPRIIGAVDGRLLANGYREGQANYYVVFRRADGAFARTSGFSHPGRTSCFRESRAMPATRASYS